MIGITEVEQRLDASAARLAAPLGVDGPSLLRERREILGIAPQGAISAGGTCRLLRAGDGRWLALNLARPDDLEAVPALIGAELDAPVWDALPVAVGSSPAVAVVERAQLLGIPAAVAVAPEDAPPDGSRVTGATAARARRRAPTVVDCSSLWAGPLCARLVAEATGADVVKVESTARPDGARFGPPEFFDRLNGRKQHVAVDLTTDEGRRELHELIAGADVVVTSARPRALAHLGIDPVGEAARGRVIVSITGYGASPGCENWVAFGDDAAVAGGAAVAAGGRDAPVFVGDAVADPLTGLWAAAVAVDLLRRRRAGWVTASMRSVVRCALTADRSAAA